jgi:O-antigen/teichoic acid export membrane protein
MCGAGAALSLEHDVEEVEAESVAGGLLAAAQHGALERKAKHGAAYVIIFTVLGTVLRLVNSIVFTHMFAPQFFGLIALVTTMVVGLSLFSHLGLQDSVVQNPRGDEPDFLNTAWTLQVIRGIGIFLVSLLLAWPAAHFYKSHEMIFLLPLLGFGCVIAGFASPSTLSLARHIGVRQLSNLELMTQVVAFVATVAWALVSPTIWALAGGRLIAEATRTIHSYTMMRELKPRFVLDREVIKEIIRFGRWILVGTIFNYLALQSDRLILGKLVALKVLALYSIAYNISDLPRVVVTQFCAKVGFPFIAKFVDRTRDEYNAIVLKYRAPVLLAGALLLSMTICTGDLFVLHVYDNRYAGASWMVAVLALGLWHTLLYSTVSPAIMALAKSYYNAFAYAVYCVSIFVLLPLGFHYFGIVGATIGVAASDFPVYIIYLFSARRERIHVWRQDLWVTCAFGGILAAGLAVRHMFGISLPFPTRLY